MSDWKKSLKEVKKDLKTSEGYKNAVLLHASNKWK